MNQLTSSSRNAGNYVSEKIQGGGAQASKEANKCMSTSAPSLLQHPTAVTSTTSSFRPVFSLGLCSHPSSQRCLEISTDFSLAVAKDSQVPIGTRVRAAGDMVSDKMNQHSHEV